MAVPIAGIHIWTEGDTWWQIAQRYTGSGLNWISLAEFNAHIRNPNQVPIGSRVNIPQELVE